MSTQRATPSQGGAYYYVVAGGLALAGGHSVIVVTAPRQSRRVSPREGRGGHRIAGVIGLCRVIPVLFVQKCPIVRRNQYTSILNFVFLPSTLFARALPIGSPLQFAHSQFEQRSDRQSSATSTKSFRPSHTTRTPPTCLLKSPPMTTERSPSSPASPARMDRTLPSFFSRKDIP